MTSLTRNEHRSAAADLFEADRSGKQIDILSLRHPHMDMDDAYEIQAALIEKKLAAGRSAIGWKIGLTSKAMQAALNIDIPDSGVLLDNMLFENSSRVPQGRFIQPRIEAEIAFIMKDELGDGDINRSDVIAATEYVTPALEILDTRIVRKDLSTGAVRKIYDTIADNAANAGIVLGNEKHDPRGIDLRWIGTIVKRNDEVEETGLGAGVLNDPAEGIVWLVKRLAEYGHGIKAGDIVISGSFIRPVEAPPGSDIAADFGSFGHVSVSFD